MRGESRDKFVRQDILGPSSVLYNWGVWALVRLQASSIDLIS